VGDALEDPSLTLFRGSEAIAGNDDWDPTLACEFEQVGAFPFPDESKDAGLSVVLNPGAYTLHVTGPAGMTGTVLCEVYLVQDL
jgi:hypothetical protein